MKVYSNVLYILLILCISSCVVKKSEVSSESVMNSEESIPEEKLAEESELKINRRTLAYGFDTSPKSPAEKTEEELKAQREATRLAGIARKKKIAEEITSLYSLHMYEVEPEYLVGTWRSLAQGYDSEDKEGYLKIEKVGDEYKVEQMIKNEKLYGIIYKETVGRPPYNFPGVFIETNKFIYEVSISDSVYYFNNGAITLWMYDIDVAGYQREAIFNVIIKNDLWNEKIK